MCISLRVFQRINKHTRLAHLGRASTRSLAQYHSEQYVAKGKVVFYNATYKNLDFEIYPRDILSWGNIYDSIAILGAVRDNVLSRVCGHLNSV